MICRLVFLLFCAFYLAAADEGDSCNKNDGTPGICRNIRNCPTAIEELRKKITPKICSFIGTDPVVCCAEKGATQTPAPTPKPTPKPTPTPTPSVVPNNDEEDEDGCEDIASELTSNKTGQKAFDMCVEYQQSLIYPCKRTVSFFGPTRQTNCYHNADDLIVGGEDAAPNEFTHMALLGYGKDEQNIQWLCGGSLISDQWILTAGHCTFSREFGAVGWIQAGALRRSELPNDLRRRVARALNAPNYESPRRYNDIALVQADKPYKLTQFLVPACIHVGDTVLKDRVLATGWGLTEYKGQVSDVLQKVILNEFTEDECSQKYPAGNRNLLWGIDNRMMMCYGDKERSKDTCQGDSGGPIMIKSKRLHCMYVITGVTSYGKRCGKIGDPAIYTRVSFYVDWIEKNVWP